MTKRADGFNAFLRTDEARQIMDAEWLLELLDEHRVTVRSAYDLRRFAQNHVTEFQLITLDEVELGVHSTGTMWRKYYDSDWHWNCVKRQPNFIPLRNIDGSPYDPTKRREARHFEKSNRPGRPPHDGTFGAFLSSPEGLAILHRDEWARLFAEDLCLEGYGGRRRGDDHPDGTYEEALRSWCPPNICGEEAIADWVKSADTLWTGFSNWARPLQYGRRFQSA